MRQAAEVYCNGEFVGHHENGVMAFGFDITDLVEPAPVENVLAVRVDNDWEYEEKSTGERSRYRIRTAIVASTVKWSTGTRRAIWLIARLHGLSVATTSGQRSSPTTAVSPSTSDNDDPRYRSLGSRSSLLYRHEISRVSPIASQTYTDHRRTVNMRVAVAGTFGPIHDGHRALFKEALKHGDEGVVVGLCSDEFAMETRRPNPRPIPPYEERARQIEAIFDALNEWNRKIDIRKFTGEYGFADNDSSLDALVVSPETEEEVADINHHRTERGMDPLKPIVVPYVYAADGEPISSTRIVNGEIDEHGNLLE